MFTSMCYGCETASFCLLSEIINEVNTVVWFPTLVVLPTSLLKYSRTQLESIPATSPEIVKNSKTLSCSNSAWLQSCQPGLQHAAGVLYTLTFILCYIHLPFTNVYCSLVPLYSSCSSFCSSVPVCQFCLNQIKEAFFFCLSLKSFAFLKLFFKVPHS